MGLLVYGFDTESYILREKHGLGVFDKRVLKETFGRKKAQVRGTA